ncbi:major facilitator superfamily domain-containing protein 5 [Macroventuria anomochaeta]|uniref:Major facilitator superfamily domain-containing protein 5 n=1 Tax=Macroventuria anomochaeta TaxID=301207 RepID=A0ACB6S6R6_9PLEO|nr:major facilitator superfamily domain-containing protein 5 [Macroventuria anomochaeta]KAF2629960.1 major facilitator superfamily domain-containing protein 5 [Macroventuria anomochaeta]
MNLYGATFAGSLLLNSLVLLQTYRSRQTESVDSHNPEKVEHRGRVEFDRDSLRKLKLRFFPIYLLVNAADWLQGPYIYPIYKDEKGLPEETVAFLFLIGFVSAGISASFAGTFADRYGRRTVCLAYCVLYSFSSFTLLAEDIRVLFLGRVLGGVCGTLLWSVFESWLVAEFNQLMLEDTSSVLDGIFSAMTILNSLVAICAGVLAEWLVGVSGTAKAPFLASFGCLSVASVAISKFWGENYGASHRDVSENAALLQQEEAEPTVNTTKSTLRYILRDTNILVLALVSCFFEGSLFLFIFFKFPALKLSHELAGSKDHLPFGLIFAILMCSMMLGSLLYNNITTSSTFPAKRVLMGTLAVASVCFFIPGHFRDECITLWCFCMFELCCGVYYPVMASIKGKLIDDSSRASVYTVLRIPLNAFVVLALSTTKEGESHRDAVFTTCSGLLLVAALVVHKILA